MKLVFALLVLVAACGGGTDCADNACVCNKGEACEHVCTSDTQCNVTCASQEACNVTCEKGQMCRVSAGQSTDTGVDCAGALVCLVTCPVDGCQVNNCIGSSCHVTCGNGAPVVMSGSTATCPAGTGA